MPTWLARRKRELSAQDNLSFSQFPLLVMEPWRVEELIQEETATQKFRLFRSINLLRLLFAIIAGGVLFSTSQLTLVTGVVMSLYAVLVILLIVLAERQKEQINRFGFFIGMFDVLMISLVLVTTQSPVEFGILFVSMLLSAMILPLTSAMIVALLACLSLFVGRLLSMVQKLNLSFTALTTDDWFDFVISTSNRQSAGFIELIIVIIGLILMTILVNQLSARSFKNEVRAQFRYKQLRQVLAFNRSVIEHLRSGVIVLTHDAKIVSINQRAMDLLHINTSKALLTLGDISGELLQRFSRWLRANMDNNTPYKHSGQAQDVSVSFSEFGEKGSGVVMLTLESINEAFQQSQQAKLASLGRLTAGVAHEIRNPLSSIKSANELLKETTVSLPNAQKLTSMIDNNVERTNQIISDILGLFKDTKSEREMILLRQFLPEFAELFRKTNNEQDYALKLGIDKTQPLHVMFDRGQLEQVLWNLCQNALKYAKPTGGEALTVLIKVHVTQSGQVHIDVMDNGQGVKADQLEHIFEPFFTGGSGSGLGLYLVRELCHANNANIVYLDNAAGGATFRLITQAFFTKTDTKCHAQTGGG